MAIQGVRGAVRRIASVPETVTAAASGWYGAWASTRLGSAQFIGQAQENQVWVATIHGDVIAYRGGESQSPLFLKTDAHSLTEAVAQAWLPWCAAAACLYAVLTMILRAASAPAWTLAVVCIACAACVPLAWPGASAAAAGACQWNVEPGLDTIDIAIRAPERIANAHVAIVGTVAVFLLGIAGSLSVQPVLCGCMALLAMGELYGVCRAQSPLATRALYASALGQNA